MYTYTHIRTEAQTHIIMHAGRCLNRNYMRKAMKGYCESSIDERHMATPVLAGEGKEINLEIVITPLKGFSKL